MANKVLPHLEKKAAGRGQPPPEPPRLQTGRRVRLYTTLGALAVVAWAVLTLSAQRPASAPAAVSAQPVTDCDRLAAHPSDTQKLAPGVEQQAFDIPAAKAACAKAVADHPGDGRLLYQLGRAYFYNDEKETGIGYFRQSVAANYPQGEMVLALILAQGNGTDPDACEAGRIWLKAARQRHLYSKIYLVNNWMDGMFADCALDVAAPELEAMIATAQEMAATPTQKDDAAQLRDNWAARKK